MVHFTKEQFDELLADCIDETLNEWLDTCSNEELAVLVCVARTMSQRRRIHEPSNH